MDNKRSRRRASQTCKWVFVSAFCWLLPGPFPNPELSGTQSAKSGTLSLQLSAEDLAKVSDFSREQIELFAVSNLMSVHLVSFSAPACFDDMSPAATREDLNLEFCYIDANFTNTTGGSSAGPSI